VSTVPVGKSAGRLDAWGKLARLELVEELEEAGADVELLVDPEFPPPPPHAARCNKIQINVIPKILLTLDRFMFIRLNLSLLIFLLPKPTGFYLSS